jgi:hypothetical protein
LKNPCPLAPLLKLFYFPKMLMLTPLYEELGLRPQKDRFKLFERKSFWKFG